MTPSERRVFNAVQRRASEMTPELAAAMLSAWAMLRDQMTEAAIVRAIQLGGMVRLLDEVLREAVRMAAYQAVRERLRRGIEEGVKYYGKTLPPKVTGNLSIRFDYLNPRVIDAVRQLETRVIQSLDQPLREVILAHVENGLRDGLNPRAIARNIRSIVGLGPSQLEQVENFRKALETAHDSTKAFDYKLRDKRFDAVLKKARVSGEPIAPDRIEKMVEAYRKRRIAQNAETLARTAALESQKLAQRLSWEDAIAKGFVDPGSLVKSWKGIMDDRERPEHVAHEGETVPFDLPYTGGYMIAGEGDPNCRCIDIISVRAA